MDEVISWEDASSMFRDSVVLYKGAPVYCVNVDRGMQAFIRDLETGCMDRVQFSMKDFTNVNARLGYVNYDVFSVYMLRRPLRQYKIGLTAENISASKGDFGYSDGEMELIQRLRGGLTEANLCMTLLGRFPSFQEVYERVKEKSARILAFDRQFALSYKGGLYYRGKQVGSLDLKKSDNINDIKMKQGYESLISLINGTYKLGE